MGSVVLPFEDFTRGEFFERTGRRWKHRGNVAERGTVHLGIATIEIRPLWAEKLNRCRIYASPEDLSDSFGERKGRAGRKL